MPTLTSKPNQCQMTDWTAEATLQSSSRTSLKQGRCTEEKSKSSVTYRFAVGNSVSQIFYHRSKRWTERMPQPRGKDQSDLRKQNSGTLRNRSDLIPLTMKLSAQVGLQEVSTKIIWPADRRLGQATEDPSSGSGPSVGMIWGARKPQFQIERTATNS